MKTLVVYVLSGFLLGLAYAFPQLMGVPTIGIALLLVQFQNEQQTSRLKIIGKLYLAFFVFHAFTNWWVSSWQAETDPYLVISGIALALGHPFFLMLPWLVLFSIRKRLGISWMIAIAPFAIAGFEWLHGQTDASYPWLSIGYSFIDSPIAQWASVVGVYGLTFFAALVSSLIAYIVLLRPQKPIVPISVLSAIVILAFVTGLQLQSHAQALLPKPVSVALIQPNENPWDKWTSGDMQVQKNQHITDSMLAKQPNAPDVVLWSETAISYAIRQSVNDPDMYNLQQWVDSTAPLITGYADVVVYPEGLAPASARTSSLNPQLRFDSFNAVMLVPSAKAGMERDFIPVHHKSMLTPFAERIPFADQLSFAMKWFEWGVGISAWGKGSTRNPLPLVVKNDTLAKVGVIICIESIYPEVAADMVDNGANLLAVITNDAWYNGTWGPRQHYNIARMRAIEQRKDVVRVGNSGVTGHINMLGESVEEMPVQTPGFLIVQANTNNNRSTFASIGSWPIIIGLALSIVLCLAARLQLFAHKLRDILDTH